MVNFEKNKAYVFRNPGGHGHSKPKEYRLVYDCNVKAAARDGLEMFRSSTAGWRETFTREQLGDYVIKEAA
jgi:hypothetical protein